jgi:hypothetical protein
VAGEVARDGGDAHHHDEVAEGEHGTGPPLGDDVAEHGQAVAGALEAAAGAEVDVGELGGLGHPCPHHRLGPHRHRPVGDDDGGVHRQTAGEDAHADQVAVAHGEREEQDERETEQPAGCRAAHDAGEQVQHRPGAGEGGNEHDGVAEVGSQRFPQHADGDAGHGSQEQRDHGRRR